MNKKISTLLAVLGLATSSFTMAQSDIVKGDYYYLETQKIGTSSGLEGHLMLTKETPDGNAAAVVALATDAIAKTDSALWKIDYTLDETSGAYSYVFKNKATGTQLSFAAGSNALTDASLVINTNDYDNNTKTGVKKNATLSGSLKFDWGDPLSTGVPTSGKVLSSYILAKDSTLSLAVELDGSATLSGANKYPIIQVMTKGNIKPTAGAATEKNPILAVKPVRAEGRALTGEELNNMLGGKNKGFQLFFFYEGKLTSENNALAGVVFEAVKSKDGEAVTATDTIVALKAKALPPLKDGSGKDKYRYAYLDTVCYDKGTPSTDGTKLTFRVDTIPTDGSSTVIIGDSTYLFKFRVDPSSANDSVAVYVMTSYNLKDGSNQPRTFKEISNTEEYPLMLAPLAGTTDKLVLTTDAATATTTTLSTETRISFKGGATPAPLFDATKVYSVKNVNERTGDDNANKYMVVAPTSATAYGKAYSNSVFDHLPSTQFVFDGTQMINREEVTVTTETLYSVEGKADTYTNLRDTFEIKAMKNVDVEDETLGWAYINEDSLKNYAFSLDYISGILEGRSINVKADSTVVATTEEGKLFKLEAKATLGKVTLPGGSGAAEIDEVKTIKNQAYKIYSKDKKFVVVKDITGKLALTSITSVAGSNPVSFYLKETENKGEYILIEGTSKYNVNSTNESLEAVGLNLTNNAFAVQVEKAPEYVLDAKGHYNIENLRGDMLAADAQGFGMFRKEGELKAAYEKNDFALYIDTAKIHATQPSYFILSGAKTGEGSELEGNFLRVMSDSANVEGYKADNGLTRLAFVPAKREATSDSLLVNYKNETLVKADSVDYKGKNTGKIAQFQFKIQYTETEGEYIVENAAGYLATYNDVLCLTDGTANKGQAQLVKLTQVSAPTANEGVEVSEVKVIAGESQVTIVGAAGRKVVISNILGQRVANTVATSDNAVIAAPQGVVVVAVEGEEAVKAIVK